MTSADRRGRMNTNLDFQQRAQKTRNYALCLARIHRKRTGGDVRYDNKVICN